MPKAIIPVLEASARAQSISALSHLWKRATNWDLGRSWCEDRLCSQGPQPAQHLLWVTAAVLQTPGLLTAALLGLYLWPSLVQASDYTWPLASQIHHSLSHFIGGCWIQGPSSPCTALVCAAAALPQDGSLATQCDFIYLFQTRRDRD